MTRAAIRATAPPIALPLALLFASGFAGLVYQVCWLRQLALLLGGTARAAAATLAIFFLGLALGSRIWGDRAAQSPNPLRTYAALELAVALSALLSLGIVHSRPGTDAFGFVNVALALGALLPPALFMGGTLPIMGQHAVRERADLGRRAAALYAANTLGGAAGAFAAGFYLPPILGFIRSYLLAVALSTAAGLVAWLASAREPPSPRLHAPDTTPPGSVDEQESEAVSRAALLTLAFVSGLTTLGLEVLWTRMFAQVLHNSVYSFAAILVTFLVSLGIGAAIAGLLSRSRRLRPRSVLLAVLCLSGTLVALTPFLFSWTTSGLSYIAPRAGWSAYVAAVFGNAAAVLLLPTATMGIVLPYLLKLAARDRTGAGKAIGRIASINTLGAILGSLAAGFVLLTRLGLWRSIEAMGLTYLAAAAIFAQAAGGFSALARSLPPFLLVAVAVVLDPARLPIVRLDSRHGEQLLASWQGAEGTVAVIRRGDGLRLQADNYYSLGGTDALPYEQTQADIPLLLHPKPKSAFFLGLGTGITAGAALAHPLERLTAVELIPEVVTAARQYFEKYAGGVFTDPRARILIDDGRRHLAATDDTYDVIVGDLFIPWQAGAGNLYTLEHFRTAARRLAPGGLFAQWLPLFQLSKEETMIIARTMLEVFPQVTVWRGDFLADRPIVALIGEKELRSLDPQRLVDNFRKRRKNDTLPRQAVLALTMIFYGGNLSAHRTQLERYPINRDDRPLIEYATPITQREERAERASYFRSLELAAWYDDLAAALATDPYLAALDERERDFARAGLALFQSMVYRDLGRADEAERLATRFSRLMPGDARARVPAEPRP